MLSFRTVCPAVSRLTMWRNVFLAGFLFGLAISCACRIQPIQVLAPDSDLDLRGLPTGDAILTVDGDISIINCCEGLTQTWIWSREWASCSIV